MWKIVVESNICYNIVLSENYAMENETQSDTKITIKIQVLCRTKDNATQCDTKRHKNSN